MENIYAEIHTYIYIKINIYQNTCYHPALHYGGCENVYVEIHIYIYIKVHKYILLAHPAPPPSPHRVYLRLFYSTLGISPPSLRPSPPLPANPPPPPPLIVFQVGQAGTSEAALDVEVAGMVSLQSNEYV